MSLSRTTVISACSLPELYFLSVQTPFTSQKVLLPILRVAVPRRRAASDELRARDSASGLPLASPRRMASLLKEEGGAIASLGVIVPVVILPLLCAPL